MAIEYREIGESCPEILNVHAQYLEFRYGSKGKKYTVEWDKFHKNYNCNCLGYTYRRRCKHITHISDSFKNQYGVKK